MEWFRVYHGISSDDKWPLIARKSGQPIAYVVAVWVSLLECASQAEDCGSIERFDPESVDAQFQMPDGATQSIIDALSSGTRPRIVDGHITNWSKRQPRRERDDDSSGRVREYRKRQKENKNNENGSGNASVTPCNASVTPVQRQETPREEERREEEIITTTSSSACARESDDQSMGSNTTAPPAQSSPSITTCTPTGEPFQMHPDWQPSEYFTILAATAGVNPTGSELDATKQDFIPYWLTQNRRRTAHEWDLAFIKAIKSGFGVPRGKPKTSTGEKGRQFKEKDYGESGRL